jgi:hypothetical protein
MVYDKGRKKVVLYGGGDKPGEHWEFDGKAWTKIITEANPGVKFHHHMVYDENLKAIILHGGWVDIRNARDPGNWDTPITWMWDGEVWKKLAVENVYPLAMAYFPERKSVIVYGYDQGNFAPIRKLGMWELKNGAWKLITDYGPWSKIEYLTKYVADNPNDTMGLLELGITLKESNRLQEAEIVFENLANVVPGEDKVTIGLIEVLILQHKTQDLDEYIEKSESSD